MQGSPDFIKQNAIDHDTRLGDLNTPLASPDRISKLKVNKETSELRHTTNQMNLTSCIE